MTFWQFFGLVVEHLGNVLAVVLILAILSGRKEARATLGWVLLVLFFPYGGAFAYLLFGRPPTRQQTDPPRRGCTQSAVRRR